jgi:hypothetical protein
MQVSLYEYLPEPQRLQLLQAYVDPEVRALSSASPASCPVRPFTQALSQQSTENFYTVAWTYDAQAGQGPLVAAAGANAIIRLIACVVCCRVTTPSRWQPSVHGSLLGFLGLFAFPSQAQPVPGYRGAKGPEAGTRPAGHCAHAFFSLRL